MGFCRSRACCVLCRLGCDSSLSAAVVIATLSVVAQLALVPKFAREAYLFRSTSLYSLQERQQADAVFGRFRHEGRPDEPIVASGMLSVTRTTKIGSG